MAQISPSSSSLPPENSSPTTSSFLGRWVRQAAGAVSWLGFGGGLEVVGDEKEIDIGLFISQLPRDIQVSIGKFFSLKSLEAREVFRIEKRISIEEQKRQSQLSLEEREALKERNRSIQEGIDAFAEGVFYTEYGSNPSFSERFKRDSDPETQLSFSERFQVYKKKRKPFLHIHDYSQGRRNDLPNPQDLKHVTYVCADVFCRDSKEQQRIQQGLQTILDGCENAEKVRLNIVSQGEESFTFDFRGLSQLRELNFHTFFSFNMRRLFNMSFLPSSLQRLNVRNSTIRMLELVPCPNLQELCVEDSTFYSPINPEHLPQSLRKIDFIASMLPQGSSFPELSRDRFPNLTSYRKSLFSASIYKDDSDFDQMN